MNTRLAALLRQRELLREHATWLEGEITREQGAVVPADTSASDVPPRTEARSVAEIPSPTTTSVAPEPDIKELHAEVRQGCMLYFAIAALLLGALIGFIYWRY